MVVKVFSDRAMLYVPTYNTLNLSRRISHVRLVQGYGWWDEKEGSAYSSQYMGYSSDKFA